MPAKISRSGLRSYYLRALAGEDAIAAQFFFQKMQEYDEALRLHGKKAARATLPTMRIRRKGSRLNLGQQYLDALKAGELELASKLQKKIATRDRSGMLDSAPRSLADVLMEFKSMLSSLR